MRRSLRFTPGNQPGPRPTSTASSTARTARPCIATTPGGSPRPWTWRPWPRPPRFCRESMILPRSGPAAATTLIRCAGSWRPPGGRSPAAGSVFTITATGFLRGMVRSLVGTMVEVGRGKAPPIEAGGTAGQRRPPPGRPHGAAPGALPGGSVLWRVSSEQ